MPDIASTIEGWLTDAEGKLLYRLAQQCTGKGVIVEIGSWKGKSTIHLARGSQAGSHVALFAIDPHSANTLEAFREHIQRAGVAHLVHPVVNTSEQAAPDFTHPIELLFIDGDHRYEVVRRDFDLWFPKLIPGGMIVFHDSVLLPGVARVVREGVYTSSFFRRVGFVHSSTYAQKITQNTLADRIRNRAILACKNIYALSTAIPIPAPVKSILGKITRWILSPKNH